MCIDALGAVGNQVLRRSGPKFRLPKFRHNKLHRKAPWDGGQCSVLRGSVAVNSRFGMEMVVAVGVVGSVLWPGFQAWTKGLG